MSTRVFRHLKDPQCTDFSLAINILNILDVLKRYRAQDKLGVSTLIIFLQNIYFLAPFKLTLKCYFLSQPFNFLPPEMHINPLNPGG